MKKILGITTALLALSFSNAVFSDNHTPTNTQQCPKSCNCMDTKIKDSLALTPEQKEKMQKIKAEYRPQLMANREKMHAIKEQIRAITKASTLNEKGLDVLIQQKANLSAQQMKLKAMMHHKIYQILTPEQRQKFNAMEQDWMKRHQNKMKQYH